MKIGIDYSKVPGERSGIGNYSYSLVNALSKIDKANNYVLCILNPVTNKILHPELCKVEHPAAHNFKVVFRNIPLPYQLLSYLRFPGVPRAFKEYMLGGIDIDIFHSHTYCVPRFSDKNKKLVVTIYDLTVMTHPEYHQKINIHHCLSGIKDAIRYADAIIAISNNTKKDLIKYLNAPEELITVIYLAAGPEYHPVRDTHVLSAVKSRYNLPENYILFVGSLEPRKNVKTLLAAYSMLPERLRKEFFLVIAGGRGWLNSEVHKAVKDLNLDERVVFIGYIDKKDIGAVYSLATVFAYPSVYEGFGLPILEAMACGTPVITSDTSSMPEVAGDAAKLISPAKTDDLADTLAHVLENEEVRKEMHLKGIKRAAQFSWEKCARETLEVYRKVYGLRK